MGSIRQRDPMILLGSERGGCPSAPKAKNQPKKASFVCLVEQQENRASWVLKTWRKCQCGCLLSTTREGLQCVAPEATQSHHKARSNPPTWQRIAVATREIISRLNWEILPHPPYSPDLAPSDYHLFLNLQNSLNGKIFTSEVHVKNVVTSFFETQTENFYRKGISDLIDRWRKCVAFEWDYFC